MHSSQPQANILRMIRPKLVGHRQGSCSDFLGRHEREANLVVRAGRAGIEKVAPYLFQRATDTRTLWLAWHDLAAKGYQVPGPNRRHFAELDDTQKWEQCRALRDALRADEYVPSPVRNVPLPQGIGRGAVPFQNFLDRVIQRAIQSIIGPLLVPHFDERAFGARTDGGHLHALALAEQLFVLEQRPVWVSGVLDDAYLKLPQQLLLDLVREHLPADDLVRLISRTLQPPATVGLLRTSPLSELLVNLLLHRFLDRRWRRRYTDVPLLRTTQHVLVLCGSVREAHRAHQALAECLEPLGMHLRGYAGATVQALALDQPAQCWDIAIDRREDLLRFRLTESAWDRLAGALCLAHAAPAFDQQAVRVIQSWIMQMAPCSPFEPTRKCSTRLKALLRELDFVVSLRQVRLRDRWLDASSRWRSLRWRR